MKVCRTIAELRAARAEHRRVALVPTMGALHAGHLSLLTYAAAHAPVVAISIFVNPTQFGPREDLSKYPRPLEADLAAAERCGATFAFAPSVEEMYRANAAPVVVDLPHLTDVLEGKHRPAHFKGVCQVVAKLFNIVQPQAACFGNKDFQQLRVIREMTESLNWPIEIIGCPTVRDADGLALSSRNQYLSADERQRALAIHRALLVATDEFNSGVRQANRLVATMQNLLLDPGKLGRVPFSIDYVAAVDAQTLKPVDAITSPTVLALAVRVGATRLIDNALVNPT